MPYSVIVVSQHEDIPLYLIAVESGACDFSTLHAARSDLSRMLCHAIGIAERRRDTWG